MSSNNRATTNRDDAPKVIDRDWARAAALGAGYRGSLNLTLQEARDLGSAIGCDFFFLGKAETERRACADRLQEAEKALAEADRLRGADPSPGQHVVVDLAQYAAATAGVRKAAAEGSS